MRAWQLCCGGVVAVVASIVYAVQTAVRALGILVPPPALSEAGCLRLPGPVGAEDGALLPELGAVILSEQDGAVFDIVKPKHGGGSALLVNGSLWVLDRLKSPKPRLARLSVPLPPGVDLHAHGLGLHGNVLFVVNHADRRGGERIERFRVEKSSSSEGPPLRLVYLSSVLGHDGDAGGKGAWTFTERLSAAINDVAPVGDHEFFFTQFRDHPSTLDDPYPESGAWYTWSRLVFPWLQANRIYHCRCSETGADGDSCARTSCEAIGPTAPIWNGISVSPDRRHLYVSASFQRQLVEFRIVPKEAGAVALERQRVITVDLPMIPDNNDASSGMLWAGVTSLEIGERIDSLREKFAAASKAAAANGTTPPRPHTLIARPAPDAPPFETSLAGAVRVDLGTGEVKPIVMSRLLWHVSFAGAMDGKVILGSAFDEGVLVCPLPEEGR